VRVEQRAASRAKLERLLRCDRNPCSRLLIGSRTASPDECDRTGERTIEQGDIFDLSRCGRERETNGTWSVLCS